MTPVRTLREFRLLGREWLSLWWQLLPALGFWYCVGRICLELGSAGATLLRPDVGPGEALAAAGVPVRAVSTVVFIAGLVVHVIALVMMIQSLATGLRATRDPHIREIVPGQFAEQRTRRDIIVETVAPFLAVYALGGFAEEQVERLFQANLSMNGLDPGGFTVNFSQWQLYLAMAAVSWGVLALTDFLGRRRPNVPLTVIGLLAKGTLVLSAFIAFDTIQTRIMDWVHGRAIWVRMMEAWEAFLALLPDVKLWFDLTVPEALRVAASEFWDTFVPGIVDSIVLPLFWLALTATVFGWHDFNAGVRANRAEAALLRRAQSLTEGRVGAGVKDAMDAGPVRAAWNWLRNGAEDFLPVIQAFRLIARSGPRFIGAYLVLAAIATALPKLLYAGVQFAMGPQTLNTSLFYSVTLKALVDLIGLTLQVALYGAAFDRCLRAAAGRIEAAADAAAQAGTASMDAASVTGAAPPTAR